MRIFAIGDLHLESGTGKTMDRFGENWRSHDQRIFDTWNQMADEDDILILAGDISWAMHIEDALPELLRIGRLKGRKVVVRGNHDYWWVTKSKLKMILPDSINILQANSIIINRVAFAGTRGWLCPNDVYFTTEDYKIYEREVGRLKLALQSLKSSKDEYDTLIVALHFPPLDDRLEPSGFTNLIDEFSADICIYAHIHGPSQNNAFTGKRNKTSYYLVSADFLDFVPKEIKLP